MPRDPRLRRTIVWAIVLGALASALCFVPLFNVLGFEFAFAIGLVASFGGADLGAASVRRAPPDETLLGNWGSAVLRGLAILGVPLVIITLNGLRVPVCDTLGGLAFYALLPGISVVLASTAGVVAASLLYRTPRLAAVAAWLFVAGSIVLGVVRFYTGPPIFGYDPFAGWFPGTLYDEDLVVGAPLLWARAYHVLLAVAGLGLAAAVRRPKLPVLGLTMLATAGAAALLGRSADLGFTATSEDIARALGGRYETPHFVVVYPRGAGFEPQIAAIALDHELRLAEVVKVFGVAPEGKITSFYFASPDEKERWMGAQATYIAKPWRHEIYLSHEGFPHNSLRHEIAHVVAGEFGDPLFHISVSWWGWPPARFNVGLIEGAAVAADWPTASRLTPHEAVRALHDLGKLPPLARLLTPSFFAFSSAQSYTTAGSFSRWLIDTRGAERYRDLYRAGGRPADFAAIYGQSLDELEAAWRAFIATVPLPAEELELARERFRRGGIFARPCPHRLASLGRQARDLVAAGRPDEALPLFADLCREDPGEPTHRLDLADVAVRAGRLDEAEAGYRAVADAEELTAPVRARALLSLVDLLGRAARLPEVGVTIERALSIPLDDVTRRNLLIRRAALGDEALRAYVFVPGDPDPVVLLERAKAVAGGLGAYLSGRLLYGRGAYADAARELKAARDLGLTEALVARENERLLVVAAYLAGDLPLARTAAAWLTAADQPAALQRLGQDWLARIEFAGKSPLPR